MFLTSIPALHSLRRLVWREHAHDWGTRVELCVEFAHGPALVTHQNYLGVLPQYAEYAPILIGRVAVECERTGFPEASQALRRLNQAIREAAVPILWTRIPEVLPSDRGVEGARPLLPDEWVPGPVPESEWAEQNRKINAFLMGRQT